MSRHLRSLRNKHFYQFIIFGSFGVLINLIGYILYLILTSVWDSPKLTMSALYLIGILISFFANRRFTFFHRGSISKVVIRYIFAQILGYLLNLILLILFVDWFGYKHELIQAIAIIIVAIFLFILLRNFVFSQHATNINTRHL